MCSASTPAMFKTKRSFMMHFHSVHGKDAPLLQPISDALKHQTAAKRTQAELENNNNNDDNNNKNNNSDNGAVEGGATVEPPSKRRKRESGPPAGLLAIAEGLKKNGRSGIKMRMV